MRRSISPTALAAVLLALCALPVAARKPQVERAVLATAVAYGRPDGTVRRIQPSERTFYCFVTLADLDAPVRLRAILVAVEAAGYRDRRLLDQATPVDPALSGKRVDVRFAFTLPRDWPPGRYRVDVLLGDKKVEELDLTVRAPRS